MLYKVAEQIFLDYIKKYKLKEIPGPWVHTYNYINNNGEIKAYMEYSSYSSKIIYKIADATYENFELL